MCRRSRPPKHPQLRSSRSGTRPMGAHGHPSARTHSDAAGRRSIVASGDRHPDRPGTRRTAPSPRRGRLARAVDGDGVRPRSAEELPPDARRGHRRADRTQDPDRRPVAGGLRILQLPGLRPRRGDHRVDPRVPRQVGNAPKLVPAARQPASLRGDRGGDDRAPRVRGRPALRDDHAHPHLRDPGAGRRGHDLHGRPRPQDDLRRVLVRAGSRRDAEAVPARRRRAPLRVARRLRPVAAARDHDGRRELHDRQRTRRGRLRRPRA